MFTRISDVDPPLCQHREEIVIVTKRSDAEQWPAIRCRARRGHPPATEYRWTFYPERPETEPDDGRMDDFRRHVRRGVVPSSLASADTAVLRGGGGEASAPYTFTTSTPVLKSYPPAMVMATSGPSSYTGAHGYFLRGRLECRAVNAVGVQNVPCVYRITGKVERRLQVVAMWVLNFEFPNPKSPKSESYEYKTMH